MDIVAINLKRLRLRRGLLQKELADRAEMNPSNLSKLERGEYTWTKDTLKRLADALGVGLDEFFAAQVQEGAAEPIEHLQVLYSVDRKLDWLLAGLAAFDEGIFAASKALGGVAAAGAPMRRR